MKYFDIGTRAEKLRPVSVFIGGRGIGKTYSALSYLLKSGKRFIYMRNTDKQMELCGTQFGNPFKRLNTDLGRDVDMKRGSGFYLIREGETVLGYGVALSTFENLRGVDLSDVDFCIFDEFIENRTLSFKQFPAFANFYETVNRNRELDGSSALICILLSNAQRLGNDILSGFGIIPKIENMMRTGRNIYIDDTVYVEMIKSEVSEAKKETALYKLAKDSVYADEAINNLFANDNFYHVGKQPLKEYVPICALDDIFIYSHKSTGALYFCRSRADCRVYSSKNEIALFRRAYYLRIREQYERGTIYFSEFLIKKYVTDLLNL